MVLRDTGEKKQYNEDYILQAIEEESQAMLERLMGQADKWFKGLVSKAGTMEELGKKLKKGGFVRVNFCSRDADGEACADKIGEEFQAEVRGTLHGKTEKPEGKCIVCGKKAKEVMYVAKAY